MTNSSQYQTKTIIIVRLFALCATTSTHICWFNFDALAQGNAYKPTKERINYRGPGRDRTHDLKTEEAPPAASCPARSLHATEIACSRLHWTTDNPSGMHRFQFHTHRCVHFELRPGVGDIRIRWFDFDALAQGNAYKPTKELQNCRGLCINYILTMSCCSIHN